MAEAGKRSIFQDGETLKATETTLNVAAGLLPGTMVEIASGEFVAATADGIADQGLILDYDMLRAGTVDDLWEDNEWVIARQVVSGALVNVRVATGQTVVRGSPLVSNGDGQLRVLNSGAATAEVPIMYAEEAITTTADNTLVRARGA